MEQEIKQLTSEVNKLISVRNLKQSDKKRVARMVSWASLRPLRVLRDCLKFGQVSTEDLTARYGYNQPPRAARDLRELGFFLITSTGKTSDGRRMAIYSVDLDKSLGEKGGRIPFKKSDKISLINEHGETCYFCMGKFSPNELQMDHRVPFEVAGNSNYLAEGSGALILVCSSCNRSKSWTCESCENFSNQSETICNNCYWVDPDNYSHISGRSKVRVSFEISDDHPNFSKIRELDKEKLLSFIQKKLGEI